MYERVRTAAEKLGKPVAILGDLCGPKIRVGKFPDGGIELVEGDVITVTTRDVEGAPGLVPSQYVQLHQDVGPGNSLLLDDGNLELAVTAVEGTEISCKVIHGGRLKDHKGINLPGINVSAPSLTEKDKADATFALELGVDYLALSFVRKAADVDDLRRLMQNTGKSALIISKIEKPEALEAIDSILAASDGIMVARGDLGVELPPEKVPLAQDQLVYLAREHSKPVIVATQMLESMIEHARPTRAEVSDVASAVRSGTDAVMLSAESASGAHPVQAVTMMDQICRQTEAWLWKQEAFGSYTARTGAGQTSTRDAVADATASLSRALGARGVLVVTRQGHTPGIMSAARPAAPLIVATADPRIARTSSLLWGVLPQNVGEDQLDHPRDLVGGLARDLGLGQSGDTVLIIRGFNTDPARDMPSVTVCRL